MPTKKLVPLLVCCLLSFTAAAQPYQSAFGFTTELSDKWLIVSREALTQNPDLLNFDAAEMLEADQSMVARVRQMVSSGRFELLYYRFNDPDFKDNINVFVSSPKRSNLAQTESPLCARLQNDIRNAYQRTEYTQIYGCERKQLYNIDSISYAFDGQIIGSRSYGFLFNSNSGTVTLTITCKVSKCLEVLTDVEALFKNMRF